MGTTQGKFAWDDWNRPGSERWFTVFAVDTSGNLSELGQTFKFEQRKKANGADATNERKNVRPKRNGDSEAPPSPTNLMAAYNEQGVIEFSWDPVVAEDLAGYVIARTDTDPAKHRGIYLELEGQAQSPEQEIKQGDMVIMSKSLVDFQFRLVVQSRRWEP